MNHGTVLTFRKLAHIAITLGFVWSASTLVSCSVSQPVRVLDEGTTEVAMSLGGPFVPYHGMSVPVPYFNAGVMYGYSENVTVTANLHATMALLKNAAVDAGAATRLSHQQGWIPEITAKGQMYVFSDLEMIKNARIFPIVSANGSYLVGSSTLLYVGADQLLQFNNPHYFISPFLGTEFPLSQRWSMQTEIKWMASNVNSAHGILRGTGAIGNHGDVALFFGFTYGLSR